MNIDEDSVTRVLNNSRMRVLWMVGGPGVGKTTTAHEMSVSSPIWKVITTNEFKGGAQDNFEADLNFEFDNMVIIQYLRNRIRTLDISITGLIIDGFPNNLKQAKMFIRYITMPHAIIHLYYSFDGMLARQQYKYKDKYSVEVLRTVITKRLAKLNPVLRKYNDIVIKVFSYYSQVNLAKKIKKVVNERL